MLKRALASAHEETEKIRSASSAANESNAVLKEQLESANARHRDLEYNLDSMKKKLAEANQALAQQDAIKLRSEKVEESLQLCMEQLKTQRQDQEKAHNASIRVATAFDRIARLRQFIETPTIQPTSPSSPESKMDSLSKIAVSRLAENSDLQVKLAQALSEIHYINATAADGQIAEIFEEEESFEVLSPQERLGEAIETAMNEAHVASVACEEVGRKMATMTPTTAKSERLSIVAELTMLQCGCNVAHAALYESAELVGSQDEIHDAVEEITYAIGYLRYTNDALTHEPFMSMPLYEEGPDHASLATPAEILPLAPEVTSLSATQAQGPPPLTPSTNANRKKSIMSEIGSVSNSPQLPVAVTAITPVPTDLQPKPSFDSIQSQQMEEVMGMLKSLLPENKRYFLDEAVPWRRPTRDQQNADQVRNH